ncbi:unnamed protein product [Urochloa humidicola]
MIPSRVPIRFSPESEYSYPRLLSPIICQNNVCPKSQMHRSPAVRNLLRSTARRASGSVKRESLRAPGAAAPQREDMGFWIPYAGAMAGLAFVVAWRQLYPPEKTYLRSGWRSMLQIKFLRLRNVLEEQFSKGLLVP